MFQKFVSAQVPIAMPKEPQNIIEFNCTLNSMLESQVFVYVIGSRQMLIQDNDNVEYKDLIQIGAKTFALVEGAKTCFRGYLIPQNFTVADANTAFIQSYSNAPRNFFFPKHGNDLIGNMSFDRKFGIWKDDPTIHVFFIRGNCVITISSPYIGFRYGGDRKSIEFIKSPDPREIAWRIDRYLKGDPLEPFSDAEKAKLKTLAITLPKETEFVQGVEYSLDFPRKLPDGTVPAEIRLVVSRGEIQLIVVKNEASSEISVFAHPVIPIQYTILFGQPDKQTVHCYHINEEGQCLAWGEIGVMVKASVAEPSENE
jgi:hypothetical protein